MTGFHWGTGSAMIDVEILSPRLDDALIDAHARRGAGFDECSITHVDVAGDSISFRLDSGAKQRQFHVQFRSIQPSHQYRVRWNNHKAQIVSGHQLLENGLTMGPLD
jgi:hypothetical protein